LFEIDSSGEGNFRGAVLDRRKPAFTMIDTGSRRTEEGIEAVGGRDTSFTGECSYVTSFRPKSRGLV
jgi:hypothetical protein